MNTVTKYGRWTVTGREGRYFLVRCECGTDGRALPFDLRAGKTTMCRACGYEALRGRPRPELQRHGLSDSPTQWVWSDMKRRCYSPGRRGYERYGARGIRVCDRWLNGERTQSGFECFIADMGVRPSRAHQLDRIDNNGNYEPGNCRWATREQQDYNKANTFRFKAFGREWTAAEAEREYGIRRQLIAYRIRITGMAPERALTQSVRVSRSQTNT